MKTPGPGRDAGGPHARGAGRGTEPMKAPRAAPKGKICIEPENLRIAGSFQVRGAYNKVSGLSRFNRLRAGYHILES